MRAAYLACVEVLVQEARGDSDREDAFEVWRAANLARGLPPNLERRDRVRVKLAEASAVVLVARQGRRCAGMLLAEPGVPSAPPASVDGSYGHVSMVFVDPVVWGRGVGSTLLHHLAAGAVARGWSALSLWTRATNARAEALYARCGFELTGEMSHLRDGSLIRRWSKSASAP